MRMIREMSHIMPSSQPRPSQQIIIILIIYQYFSINIVKEATVFKQGVSLFNTVLQTRQRSTLNYARGEAKEVCCYYGMFLCMLIDNGCVFAGNQATWLLPVTKVLTWNRWKRSVRLFPCIRYDMYITYDFLPCSFN